jgi:CRISPR-associated protein Cas1
VNKPYYIFKNGDLRRKQNTLFFEYFEDEEGRKYKKKKVIPVNTVDSIFLFGESRLNTKLLNFLAQNGIILHVFNYYGFYSGSYMPRQPIVSGSLIVDQVKHYLDDSKRLDIARKIVHSANYGIVKVLKYYDERRLDLESTIEEIEDLDDSLADVEDISQLMGKEGNIRRRYYSVWGEIFITDEEAFTFDKRNKQPPDNPVNGLISFGNSILYTTVLSEIYKTPLDPTVSFLHEPFAKRYSLSLDLAEIFKPLCVDRLIFSLVNQKRIQKNHFKKEMNYAYLKENGRKIFLKAFEQKMQTTVEHPKLKRNVSYRHLIRLECYKLIKHLLGDQVYQGLRMWW